jgi:hypothetical protein
MRHSPGFLRQDSCRSPDQSPSLSDHGVISGHISAGVIGENWIHRRWINHWRRSSTTTTTLVAMDLGQLGGCRLDGLGAQAGRLASTGDDQDFLGVQLTHRYSISGGGLSPAGPTTIHQNRAEVTLLPSRSEPDTHHPSINPTKPLGRPAPPREHGGFSIPSEEGFPRNARK